MYARVHCMNTLPEKRNEVYHCIRDTVLPSDRDWQGFKGSLAQLDPTIGKGIAIAPWETEDDLRASASSHQEIYEVALRVERITAE